MKKLLSVFVASLSLSVLAGCGESKAASAVGVYNLDKDAFVAIFKEQMPPGAPAEALEEIKKTVSGSVELMADGKAKVTFTMPPMPTQETTGTWKVDGEMISITAKNTDGKEETKSGKLDGKTLVITEDMGGKTMEMRFTR